LLAKADFQSMHQVTDTPYSRASPLPHKPAHIWALRPVALLEFLLAAARARIIATHVLQGVAHGLLVSMAAVRAVDMAVVVIMVIVIVVAVRTMDMGLLSH